ncbi:hypothetical protein [Brachybacterium ginsengisoli]|uniref:hypothetical protein n=1 Tax=Brachybacterium ginsengisoli TaxID=1331682 RepID=UPI00125F866C|nr:hypothetical protein [Brachybacterium ginsengisoli]
MSAQSGPRRGTTTNAPTAESSTALQGDRSRGVQLMWWLHGAARVVLALVLAYNGAIKLGLHQFGVPDVADALITQGEMSPMGLLSRMVGFSPLFQFLAGAAEIGAALALLWWRTAAVGALLSLASMSFILVLNLGYDMPGKELSIGLLLLAGTAAAPWVQRIMTALLLDRTPAPRRRPVLLRSHRAAKLLSAAGPVLGGASVLIVAGLVVSSQPARTVDDQAPSGVWIAQETAEAPIDQSGPWRAMALGRVAEDGKLGVQVRTAQGELLSGTYRREGDILSIELRPLQRPGQTVAEHAASPAERHKVTVTEHEDGTITVAGEGIDQDLAPAAGGTVLYDRGFHWGLQADDPFER